VSFAFEDASGKVFTDITGTITGTNVNGSVTSLVPTVSVSLFGLNTNSSRLDGNNQGQFVNGIATLSNLEVAGSGLFTLHVIEFEGGLSPSGTSVPDVQFKLITDNFYVKYS
jgi:hypothetical protein